MEFQNQMKFFIVDDDAFCRNVYEHCLNEIGYKNITQYENGKDCLDNLALFPTVIFLDHNMEDITGFEVLIKIKRYNPNIFVVMVSAQDTIKTAVDALKYGAFDYIVKDDKVCDSLKSVVEKVIFVQEELKKSKPTFVQKILQFF